MFGLSVQKDCCKIGGEEYAGIGEYKTSCFGEDFRGERN